MLFLKNKNDILILIVINLMMMKSRGMLP